MNPCVELVFDKNGFLRACYALHHDTGIRVAKLYCMDSEEHIRVGEPSVTELRFHSFCVKRTYLTEK